VNADYFHCSMHCLNLSAMKTIKIPSLQQAQEVVSDTVSCFRSSAKRSGLLKSCIQRADDDQVSKCHLTNLCTTRFVERHTSIVCFRSLLPYVADSLTEMKSWQAAEARKTAHTLINSMSQSETLVGLAVLEKISSIMLPTTRLLQTAGLDLVEAMASIDDLLGSLNALRTSEGFVEILDNATAAAQLLEVTLVKPRTAGRSVYRAAASRGPDDSIEDYYRINVYFPALDAVLQDVELRFGPKQRQAASFSRAVPAFMQFDDFDSDWAKLQNAVGAYNNLITDPTVVIKAEYELWLASGINNWRLTIHEQH